MGNRTVVVPIDETVAPSLEGADEEGKVVVPNEKGTYTIDSTGKSNLLQNQTSLGNKWCNR